MRVKALRGTTREKGAESPAHEGAAALAWSLRVWQAVEMSKRIVFMGA
jgi:hypothetical protein